MQYQRRVEETIEENMKAVAQKMISKRNYKIDNRVPELSRRIKRFSVKENKEVLIFIKLRKTELKIISITFPMTF